MVELGELITKKELGKSLNEKELATNNRIAGFYRCTQSTMDFIFVNLNKDNAKQEHKFNDYFDGDVFHWDSQPRQSIQVPTIQAIVKGERQVHLFTRVFNKVKGVTQPFVYCGPLTYADYDENTRNPVHLIFSVDRILDDARDDHPIREIYDWKPGHVGQVQKYKKEDPEKIVSSKKGLNKPDSTERKGLVTSRVGQGYYRSQLRERWNDTCPLTGCQIGNILIASHIVPWKDSTDEERLDVDNGILLSPDVDALFDRHLISFTDEGRLIKSKSISEKELLKLGVSLASRIRVFDGMKSYLKRHRLLLQT